MCVCDWSAYFLRTGKRVDFSARTVISPDPNLRVDQVGVPEDHLSWMGSIVVVVVVLSQNRRFTDYSEVFPVQLLIVISSSFDVLTAASQVGVPERVAKIMTFPEMVRSASGEESMSCDVLRVRLVTFELQHLSLS